VVVRETQMPAALVELAFLSNPTDESLLAEPSFQERAARAIVAGLHTQVEGTGLRPLVAAGPGH
jgi:N-acetylmuramoyl-L-alanine amidase